MHRCRVYKVDKIDDHNAIHHLVCGHTVETGSNRVWVPSHHRKMVCFVPECKGEPRNADFLFPIPESEL